MVQRRNLQVLNDFRVIWPILASLVMHVICLSLIAMPHVPKVPEFLTVELKSMPQLSTPASASKTASAQNAAAVASKIDQPQPIAKSVEMQEPVKQVNAIVTEAKITRPLHASEPVQTAATAQPVSAPVAKSVAASAKTEPTVPIGPVEVTFGASDGPSFLTEFRPVYPRMARKLGKQGTVLLRIDLDERGALTSAEVVKKAGNGLDEAALNAVKASRFRPAKQHGIPVGCKVLLPITFKLEG